MLVTGATGVSRYAEGLLDTLPLLRVRPFVMRELPGTQAGHIATTLLPHDRPVVAGGPDRMPGCEILWGRHLFRSAQAHFSLYQRLRTVRAAIPFGIMHWTYPVPLRMHGWINIYTIHDVIPLDRPELANVDPRRLRQILTRILPHADRIVTVSETARARIIAQTGCDSALVVNCYQAVMPPAVVEGALPFGLHHGGYFLYCGLLSEPRKNVARIIAAHRQSGTLLPLVLVGPDGDVVARLQPGAAEAPVIQLPYLSRDRLLQLQAGACAMLFPSLAEGFGLPVVEAMAAGTPALTSDRDALAEVAGGAALLVDPNDVGAIADGIVRLGTDPALRSKLRADGLIRARMFGRARFAVRLRSVYADALADRNRFGVR